MKKFYSVICLSLVLAFTACIDQDYPVWTGADIEFQDAVVRAPVAGQTFPRISVANTVGEVNLQVNLVAAHRANDEVIAYRVVEDLTTAVAGTDYNTSGNFTIPANTSFGSVNVQVLNTGAIGGFVDLTLELVGNENLPPAENYKRVQIRITRPS
ncbi:DUF4843 domain-containing protein [Belliella marina]|uniref:DUF4843 domain-containing protein n=1 Tax=Belliella marina TaxID=1644146 RepID=A0ABW4VVI1_9BACT